MAQKPHYVSYIKPHKLDAMQSGLGDHLTRSEQTFIRAHQIQELYFLQLTTELEALLEYIAIDNIDQRGFTAVERHFQRALSSARLMADALDMLQTISPLEFQKFRSKFGSASGRQSPRVRYYEALLGFDQEISGDVTSLRNHGFVSGTEEALYLDDIVARIERAMQGRNLKRSIYDLLGRLPFPSPTDSSHPVYSTESGYDDAQRTYAKGYITGLIKDNVALVERATKFFLDSDDDAIRRIRIGTLLIFTRMKAPLLNEPRRWVSAALSLEDLWFTWQSKHVLVVRRSLGFSPGTGGTAGIDYLMKNLQQQLYLQIHEVKAFVASSGQSDDLTRMYGFSAENISEL